MRNLISAGLNKLRGGAEPTFARGNRNATVIAVAAQKGGVGKTTSAVSLACALARPHGGRPAQRVLLIDIDPQGHVGAALRESLREGPVSISDILLANRPRDLLEAVVESGIDNLHLTPPDKTLNETDAMLQTRVGRELILQGALETARTHYDTIVIDCPPNLGNLTYNGLLAADWVLIPCDMSILAFDGVADILGTVRTITDRLRHPLDVLGILRTRVDRRNIKLNEGIGRGLVENYGDLLLETEIPINSALAKAQVAGRSIYDFSARSRGATAYLDLADEVVRRTRATASRAVGR